MINRIMKRFALSREGAKGLIRAIAACTVGDIVLMFPVGLLYFLVSDFLDGAVPKNHYALYGVGIAAALLLIFLSELWKYNATYFSTYRESGRCRIRLAEKLRRLPLSFFGKRIWRILQILCWEMWRQPNRCSPIMFLSFTRP